MAKTYTAEEKAELVEQMLSKALYELELKLVTTFKDADFDARIDGAKFNKAFNEISKMYTEAVI